MEVTQSALRFISLFLLLSLSGCAFKSVVRAKQVAYAAPIPERSIPTQHLNVFSPREKSKLHDVLVFIHGGAWRSGKKELYSFFGNRFARKGIVTVVIDYPLGPKANYGDMANASAQSLKWVYENIKSFGGDPEKIFVSGHSSGGHLAALISTDREYFIALNMKSPIKGAIFIDAAGLDMFGYLQKEHYPPDHIYMKIFSTDSSEWKKASPIFHVSNATPDLLILRGEKTYPSIERSNEKFVSKLKGLSVPCEYVVQPHKKHIPMIIQFFFTWNPNYRKIQKFMKDTGE